MRSFESPRLRRTAVFAIVISVLFLLHLCDDYANITPLYWQSAQLKGGRSWDIAPIEPYWEWNYTTDANNLLLTHTHCEQAFHGLFKPIDQSVRRHRAPYNKVKLSDLDQVSGTKGVVRAMIYDQQLYVISTAGSISKRSLEVLAQINRALVTSPEEVANIEFTFTTEERSSHYSRSSASAKTWAFARAPTDHKTWLMPDYTSFSWPEAGPIESFHDARRRAEAIDTIDWEQKKPHLHWRGSTSSISQHPDFLSSTANAPWADVQITSSPQHQHHHETNLSSSPCESKYLAHPETSSYNNHLKYLQLCTSVLLLPSSLKWTTSHTHLLQPTGPEQNYLEVSDDWSDVRAKIRHLQSWDTLGERIARNGARAWRERWATPAAEVCEWRRLMRGWREGMGFEVEFYDEGRERGVLWERFVLERVGGEG
ncbi:hypothetical protein M409DRAFT_50730 [Zasmidium cellare ATCC 36951]|uniref:Glycosyl transferase CAP10 domain-containing protein n=1 Tax=Zasmidium cellare ATCC 36951 TaxID=1080233 RepID=A0A6A6D0U5_ZASCE|nr:uncharacterized protein M409DRAFT_50730 [Zasmidium cellare ATCC 36951]KAF2171266.1 hypothetical protein M409DRAFT_50730 [Zasmidium cellare ATCC 36951]